jgi:hypothetical protein
MNRSIDYSNMYVYMYVRMYVNIAPPAAQKPMRQLDMSRYNLDPPVGAKAGDVGEWRRAVEAAQAQLEHSSLRLMNLEIMSKHAQKVWMKHLAEVDALEKGSVPYLIRCLAS